MTTNDDRAANRAKVIEVLNKARSMELFAITQYMNQHYTLDDVDYGILAAKIKKISIDEMRHAEEFAERIKDLGGEPTARQEGTLEKRQDVHVIYSFNSALEGDTLDQYNDFIKICRECGDQVSANLFERIINEEQEHHSYFDDIDSHIKELGDHFLAKMAASGSAD